MATNIFGLPENKSIDLFGASPQKEKIHVPKVILKRAVWKRDKGICQLCQTKIRSGEDWDLARNRAGQSYTFKNCFVAHHTCNISQGRKTKGQIKRGIGLTPRKTQKRGGRKKRTKSYNPFEIKLKPIKLF